MIELIKYFRILFLSPKLSIEVIQDFTEDHIQRLLANNPGGIFSTILANVTAAYNNFFGDASSKNLNEAVQKSLTTTMMQNRTDLEKYISDGEKLIKYTYRTNTAKYKLKPLQGNI